MLHLPLANRHAIVTGGGRGIGAAIVTALEQAGAKVSILARTAQPSQFACDVTDEASVRTAIAAAVARSGPCDILVNNAGSAETAPFVKATPDQFRRMFDVHVLGAVHCTQAVLPSMLERGQGRIINIASTAAHTGSPYIAAYCAAKHALLGLTRSLALEIVAKGVTVNAVCPGYTETDLVRDSLAATAAKQGKTYEEVLAKLMQNKPMGRLIQPEEVAASIVWLSLPQSAAVTGALIPINAGEVP